MEKTFDPYHQWLGIRDTTRPNHYRLLGLEAFESDPDVIQNAADARMAHVRTYQTGSHSEDSQRLLNELSTAKITLLNATKKAAYDARLRDSLAAASSQVARPPAAPGPQSSGVLSPPPFAPPASTSGTLQSPSGFALPPPPPGYGSWSEHSPPPPPSRAAQPPEPEEDSVDIAIRGLNIPAANRAPAPARSAVRPASGVRPSVGPRPLAGTSPGGIPGWAVGAGIAGAVAIVALIVLNMASSPAPTTVTRDPDAGKKPIVDPSGPRIPEKRVETSTPPVDDADPFEGVPAPPEGTPVPRRVRVPLGVPFPAIPKTAFAPSPGRPAAAMPGEVLRLVGHTATVHAVALTPDLKTAFSVGADNRGRAWDVTTGEERGTMVEPVAPRDALFVRNRPEAYILGDDHFVHVIDRQREIRRLGDGLLPLDRIVCSRDGSHVLGYGNGPSTTRGVPSRGCLVVWRSLDGRETRRVNDHPGGGIVSATLSADGTRVLTVGADKTLRLYPLDSNEPQVLGETGQSTTPVALFYRNGRRIVTLPSDGKIVFLDTIAARPGPLLRGPTNVAVADLTIDGRILVTGGTDKLVQLWDTRGGKELASLAGHAAPIRFVAFVGDGRTALSASVDGTISFWDVNRYTDHWSRPEGAPEEGPGEPMAGDPSPPEPPPEKVPPKKAGPAAPPLKLGSPRSPVELFARYVYDADALGADVGPTPSPSRALAPRVAEAGWPAALKKAWDEAPAPGPQPFASPTVLAAYQDEFAAEVAEIVEGRDDDAHSLLARKLLDAASTAGFDDPQKARFLACRAFGVACHGKGNPDLATAALTLFEEVSPEPPPELALATALAGMNLHLERQKLFRRLPAQRDAAAGLSDGIVVAMGRVADRLIDAGMCDDARRLAGTMSLPLAKVDDATLKNLPNAIRERATERDKRGQDYLKAATEHAGEPASAEKSLALGLFLLGELEDLTSAAPHLAAGVEPRAVAVSKDYRAADADPARLVPLARSLDALARAWPPSPGVAPAAVAQRRASAWRLALAALDRVKAATPEPPEVVKLRVSIDAELAKVPAPPASRMARPSKTT